MTVETSKATYSFFAYARGGIASGITDEYDPTLANQPTSHLAVAISGGADTAHATVGVYGPGDVVAIDIKQITRVAPESEAPAWTPNYFPHVEFDRPDYPWLFSPYAPTGDRLHPWLALIVVADDADATYVERHETSQRPALTLSPGAMATQLPDLEDRWAWAYVQVAGDLAGDHLASEQSDHPERVCSRIVAPRRLRANARYRACLVPAYEAGRAAGMGESTVSDTLGLAWTFGAQGASPAQGITLPVYYSWRFATGPDGDFASLARRLVAVQTPDGLGERDMDTTDPGAGLPSAGTALGGLQGALMPPTATLGRLPTATFRNRLRTLLNQADPDAGAPARPLELPPPIYGRWPVGASAVPPWPAHRRPTWLAELNLDPRNRTAAGIGTELARRRQQQLMTSAWAQIGPIDKANQALAQAQLARHQLGATHRARIREMKSNAHLVMLCAPALARVPAAGPDGPTLFAQTDPSRTAPGLTPMFRRLTRPRGPVARRGDPAGRLGGVLDRLNSDALAVRPARAAPDGTQMLDLLAATTTNDVALGNPANVPHRDGDKLTGVEFQHGAEGVQGAIQGWGQRPDPAPAPAVNLGELGKLLRLQLDPELTVAPRVARRVSVPASRGWNPADPLEPIMAAPEFPTPMFWPLRALSQDYVLPGMDKLKPENVTVVKTNNRFVNSFMIGLNHEMSRQLLWRGYPTDQRGTYFRQFWDHTGRVPPPGETAPPDLHDLSPLDGWTASRLLSTADGASAAGGELVLVVRGELLRRFPNAIVSVVDATGTTPMGLGTTERYPVFTGALAPDARFLGFDIGRDEALHGGAAGKGWFFVIAQHPTEPQFGLAEEDDPGAPNATNLPGMHGATWADLSWAHLAADDAALNAMTYAPAKPLASATPTDTSGPAWGTNAADMAAVSLRDPVRIAIHAGELIK
jgi:hypothetical protein